MSTKPLDIDQLANLSDEEISKLSSPEVPVETSKVEEPPKPEDKKEGEETPELPAPTAEEQPKVEEPKVEEAPKLIDPAKKDGPDAFAETKSTETPAPAPKVEEKGGEPAPAAAAAPAKKDEAPASLIDYKGFYDRVMAPFRANGKDIKLENADEVVQLMQMGANYTKKMQELQHVRKFVMMLQNNGLLDEAKLSFLIDLDKKNPEAIKKLLADAKIDPVELDVSKQNYRNTGAHAVSDQEVALNSTLDELNGLEGGKETLQSVQNWDKASKNALWENPAILKFIHTQRINGMYAKITAEMDRLTTLGQIPPGTPFLAAYKKIGDELTARGAFGPITQPATPAGGQRPVSGAPVAVRTAPVKTPDTTAADPRVKAAAPTRTSPRTAPATVNYLAMSDEDFLKLPQNKI